MVTTETGLVDQGVEGDSGRVAAFANAGGF
jgi:hypothetical protein